MPRSDAGWTGSALELVKIQLLDKVVEETEQGRGADTSQFLGDISDDDRLLRTAAKALDTESLAKAHGDYDGGVTLLATPAGDALAQTRRERRANRKLRAVACRDALLDWCYGLGEVANIGNFPGVVQAHFEGDPFTDGEIQQAVRDLKEKGLATGDGSLGGGIARPSLTAAGRSVVEDYDSSIRAYETHDRAPSGRSTTINFGGGTFSGQLSVGDNNQMTQAGASTDPELAELITAVLESATGTVEEKRVAKLVAQLQLEADEEEPEPTTVSKTLDRLQDTAAKTGSSALILAVGKLAEHGLRMLGLT